MKLTALTSVQSSRNEWEEPRCTEEQKEILNFFKLPIRPQLTYRNADRLIEILFSNKTYAKRWDQYETQKFARQAWFENNLGFANDLAAFYGCQQLTKEAFIRVIDRLEAQGLSLQTIENDYLALFHQALYLYPELRRPRAELK